MAIFKPMMGNRSALDSVEKHAGYAYFCTDDGTFHIDYADKNGQLHRKQINEDYIKQLLREQTVSWSLIKSYCDLGIADKFFKAGMQLTDNSPKYGNVIFDIVNVTPTEVIIQTHSVIGESISIGNFEVQGDVSYSSVEITSAIASGEEFCLYMESIYNGSPSGFTHEEYYTATQDIPVGTYDYFDLTGNYCESSRGNNVTQVITYNEVVNDIDDPPAILLEDYAASVNANMSKGFQRNVGTGFVPSLYEVGGDSYEGCWQYYKDEGDPMTGSSSTRRSKGGTWAMDASEGWSFGIQTVDYNYGAYLANAIDDTGSHTEIWNDVCGIAPAFKIGTPYNGTVTIPTEGNIAVFDDAGNAVDGGKSVDDVIQTAMELSCSATDMKLADKADKSQVDTLSEEVSELRESIGDNDPAIFIPSVSDEGVISWTNNQDLVNPSPVNIKGKTAYEYAKEDGYTGSEAEFGEDINPDKIKAEVRAELSQVETPKIVSSVEEMTDTSKHYVLNGNIWASRTTTREGETILVPNFTNLIKFDASGNPTNVVLNQRYSGSAGAAAGYLSAQNGSFAITDLVGGANYGTVYINQKPAGQSKAAYFVSETIAEVNSVDTINTGDWVNGENGEYKASLTHDVSFVKFSAQMSTSAITADNIKGLIVTLNEPISYTEQKAEDVTVEEWYDTGISYAPTFKTDLIGVLGENNVIYLSDNTLPSGTYTLKASNENYDIIGIYIVE